LKSLIPMRLVASQRGILIPIIALGILSALSVVVLYNSSLRSQRGLDILFEEDLRSYYISEAGFQYATGRLDSIGRYDKRWYAPQTDFAQSVPYGYEERGGKGVFEYFLREVLDSGGKFSHLFILARGIYYTGKKDRFGNKEKNITLLKGELKFQPANPASDDQPQKLFVVAKVPVQRESILKYILDPRYSSFFFRSDRTSADLFEELLKALRSTSLEEIDWMNEPRLVTALARLESFNQSLGCLSRISLKAMKLDQGLSLAVQPQTLEYSFPDEPEELAIALQHPEDPLQRVPEGSTDVIKDLRHQLPPLSSTTVERLIVEEYIEILEELEPGSLVRVVGAETGATPIHTTVREEVRNLKSQLNDSLAPVKMLENLRAKSPSIQLPSGDFISLDQFEDLKNFESQNNIIKDIIGQGGSGPNGNGADEDGSASPPAEDDRYSILPYPGPGDDTEEEIEVEVIDYYEDPFDPDNQNTIIGEHTGDLFEGVDTEGPTVTDELEDGFMKIFHTRLKDDVDEFAAYKVATTGRNPTKEEWDVFFASKPIPDREFVKGIGKVLDELHSSSQYSYHYGAHVRDHLSYGKEAIYTEVEWSPETFKEELQLKLLYYQNPVSSNGEFLEMFRKSSWGDSLGVSSMGKDRSTEDNTNYFLVDQKTGERIDLVDYLKTRL
jgi:hypothetical protein